MEVLDSISSFDGFLVFKNINQKQTEEIEKILYKRKRKEN